MNVRKKAVRRAPETQKSLRVTETARGQTASSNVHHHGAI
ncbi:hypothetical protein BRPE64_CCDS07870 [Caballeronia insecticola]|uniref:Uncharacterized protein n=1 Tax=Caballeronia insecticola TaxID=758793 RepID=R4WZ26_9BURK|nr:hypothetical protein BRPE64_CCDS07870 [Caballeronia insecticola]